MLSQVLTHLLILNLGMVSGCSSKCLLYTYKVGYVIRIWPDTTDADIMVLSETCLKNSIPNKDINIVGYNVYRADRSNRGGGVAIFNYWSNWLQPSDDLKAYCNLINLFQIVNNPIRPNLKCPENSSLIDLIIANVPHKYSMASVFANDISDHCVVAMVRNIKFPKSKPCIITKRDMKHFMEQAFLHDLSYFDWGKINLIPEVESAWSYFYESFTQFINKHSPFRKF